MARTIASPNNRTIANTARPDTLDRPAELSLRLAAMTISVASAISLALEVLLTRLFSLLFEYHYVFVATSLAICGLGLGAAWGAWLLAHRSRNILRPGRIMIAVAIALALDSLLFSLLPWAGAVYVQALLALPPFVLIGLLTATLFAARPSESARFYASDLLGAAVGTVGVLLMIVWSGVFTAIAWLGLLAALLGLLLTYASGDRPAMRVAAPAAALIALLVIAGQLFNLPRFDAASIGGAPPDKTMLTVLHDPAQQGHIAETVWGPFARLDLVDTSDPDTKLLFTDAGAGSYMIRFDGDLSKVADLKSAPDYLPFAQGVPADTLVLGAGAGKDVVLSLLAGSQHVTAVELNPEVIDLTRRYSAFNGNILDRLGVQTVVADGRSFVEQSDQKYDLIYMNLVYSQAAGHENSPLAESYIFTEEALRSYWRHLKPGGRIGIVTHNGFEGSRVLLTAIAALQDEGLQMRQALDRVLLYQATSDDPNASTSVLLVTRSALNEDQLSAQVSQADALGMRGMYVPVLFELPLKDLVKGNAGIYDFARNGDYNLVPSTDDQPYFYQLTWGLPDTIRLLFIVTGAIVLIYLLVTVRAYRRPGGIRASALPNSTDEQRVARPSRDGTATIRVGALACYFAILGAAYMLVMIPLVQRFYLLMGNPTLALVVTLEGLLVGAGLGSLLGSRLRGSLLRPVTVALTILVALLIAEALIYPLFSNSLLQTPLYVRIAAVLLLTLPLGLLIGLPFPSGLRIAGNWLPRSVPAMWGLNAISAVFGSVIASAIAMTIGFEAVLLGAAILYALAALLLITISPKEVGA